MAEGVPHNDDRYTVMVIALHNIAVEHEYLKQVKSGILFYSINMR